ncbi:MAG: polysaccharide biosynthesis tyrosine autokinase [Actinomycetota bacterium]|nr:polysaccharide biosynthesis tyrosine autokinase [Actinomycetota bacterium]
MEEKKTQSDEIEIDLREYMSILAKGKWVIILCTFLAIVVGLFLVFTLKPVYEASAKVLIVEKSLAGELFGEYNPEYSTSSEVNFQTQMEMLNSRQFKEEVIKKLSLKVKPDELEEKINVSRVGNTKVIEITVQDNDPQLASDIANTLAQVYIDWSTETYQQSLKTVLEEINVKLEDSKQKLDSISAEISNLEGSGREVPESLRKELEMNSELYVMLSEKYENLRINEAMGESAAKITETAVVPEEPVKPNKKIILISALLIGLILGCGIVLTKEFLDNTIKTTSDVKKYYGLNVISRIAYDKAYDIDKRELVILKDPDSQVSESIKELRTNLSYFNVDRRIKTIGITSAQLEEGKTFISANLAVALAQSGIKTLLLNADLRNPVIHKYFGYNNISGITSVLTGHSRLSDEVMPTKVKNLSFLSSGPVPPNPAELLESEMMGKMLDTLSEKYDYIIIDTPPIVPVTDLIALAKKIDSILVVVRVGKVTRATAMEASEKIKVVRNKVLGAVLNGVIRKGGYYYYYK